MHGDFVFFILPLDQKQIIDAIAEFGFQTTPFRYEPMPVLRASTTLALPAPSGMIGFRIEEFAYRAAHRRNAGVTAPLGLT